MWPHYVRIAKRRIKHSPYARQTVEAVRRHLMGEGRTASDASGTVKLHSIA